MAQHISGGASGSHPHLIKAHFSQCTYNSVTCLDAKGKHVKYMLVNYKDINIASSLASHSSGLVTVILSP